MRRQLVLGIILLAPICGMVSLGASQPQNKKPSETTPPAKQPAKQIRVSGKDMASRLILPAASPDLNLREGEPFEGVVQLEAVIGMDGKVKQMKVLSGKPALAKACLTAISKWQYRPYVAEGVQVEVVTEITVKFKPPPPE